MKSLKFSLPIILLGLTGLFSSQLMAQDQQSAEDQLRQALAEMAPDLPITSITESVLPGVYELISGAQVYYLTPDGRYRFDGSLIDMRERVNLSEQRRASLQLALIETMPEDQMLVFNNETNDADRWITVFTDTDCGYCQKLHQEVDEITQADIRVRYLMFPRAGMDSPAASELESVWCADDQQAAMTAAKSRRQVESATCENPIQSHVDLARQVDLRGTPLIYLDDGTKIPGYRPAADLIRMIKESEPVALK